MTGSARPRIAAGTIEQAIADEPTRPYCLILKDQIYLLQLLPYAKLNPARALCNVLRHFGSDPHKQRAAMDFLTAEASKS